MKLDSKEKIFNSFAFTEVSIEKANYGYHTNQSKYVSPWRDLNCNSAFSEFGTLRHKLDWTALTRSRMRNLANKMSQVTEVTSDWNHTTKMNEAIRNMPNTKHCGMRCYSLELKTLGTIGISDVSFAINEDISSHLGIWICKWRTLKKQILSRIAATC